MDELINCLSAVSFRVLAMLAGIVLFFRVMLYIGNRYCSDGTRNPNNPNRPLENYSKKELISLIRKERQETKKMRQFLSELYVHDLASKSKAFKLMVIKSILGLPI